MRKLFQTHEFVLLVLVVLLCVAIGIKNPAFWSLGNVFDLLKSSVTLGLLALGVLVILISGDIDISFPAIAAFSMYVTCLIAGATGLGDHIAVLFGMAAATGGLLGVFQQVIDRQVLPHGQVGKEREILIDHLNPTPDRIHGAQRIQSLIADHDRTAIGTAGAREDLNQCRFAARR
jgi:hypothetical protein